MPDEIQYTTLRCKFCNGFIPKVSPIPITNKRRRQRTTFCSRKCSYRSSSIKYYNKVKDKKVYKAKRNVYFKKWYSKNKIPFIKRMSDYQRERLTRMRLENKKEATN